MGREGALRRCVSGTRSTPFGFSTGFSSLSRSADTRIFRLARSCATAASSGMQGRTAIAIHRSQLWPRRSPSASVKRGHTSPSLLRAGSSEKSAAEIVAATVLSSSGTKSSTPNPGSPPPHHPGAKLPGYPGRILPPTPQGSFRQKRVIERTYPHGVCHLMAGGTCTHGRLRRPTVAGLSSKSSPLGERRMAFSRICMRSLTSKRGGSS